MRLLMVDFDGTITKRDTWKLLIQHTDMELNDPSEGMNDEAFWSNLSMRVGEFKRFLDSYVKFQEGFRGFYERYATELGVVFVIVSGGIEPIVRYVLQSNNYDCDLSFAKYKGRERALQAEELPNTAPVLIANKGRDMPILQSVPYHPDPEFPHKNELCSKCSHCKLQTYITVTNIFDLDDTIYIGNGLTDLCAARRADYVFSFGDRLNSCLDAIGKSYIDCDNFYDLRDGWPIKTW